LISKRGTYLFFNQKLPDHDNDDDDSEEENSSSAYQKFFTDQEGYFSDINSNLMVDESHIFNSLRYKNRASYRAKQIWAWQELIQSFKHSFEPKSSLEEKLTFDETESPYTCQCCFLSYYHNTNPIVYCDYCDSGVH